MTEEQIAELERRAEAATPGEWFTNERDHTDPYETIILLGGDAPYHKTIAKLWLDDAPVRDYNAQQRANARFIAAANPATVLALIAALKAEKKRAEEAEALWEAIKAHAVRAVDVLDAFADVFTEMKTKDSLGDAAVCADASRSLFAAINSAHSPHTPRL